MGNAFRIAVMTVLWLVAAMGAAGVALGFVTGDELLSALLVAAALPVLLLPGTLVLFLWNARSGILGLLRRGLLATLGLLCGWSLISLIVIYDEASWLMTPLGLSTIAAAAIIVITIWADRAESHD